MSWPVLLIICVLSSALASIFLKIGAEALTESLNFFDLVGNQMVWVGGFFYVASFLGYIYVLRVAPLSLAQPVITSGVSVVTVLFAIVFLRESMALMNWVGLVLICVGIFFLFFGRV